jgi:hypothetical protein
MRTASFAALERADGVDREPRDRRKFFLREARSLTERLELRPKGPRSAQWHDRSILTCPIAGVRAFMRACGWPLSAACLVNPASRRFGERRPETSVRLVRPAIVASCSWVKAGCLAKGLELRAERSRSAPLH